MLLSPLAVALLACRPVVPAVDTDTDTDTSTSLETGSSLPALSEPRGHASAAGAEVLADAVLEQTWRPDHVMVELAEGADPEEVAADHDLALERRAGPAGLVLLAVEDGRDRAEVLADLRADARVAGADRVANTVGASQSTLRAAQWHLDVIDVPNSAPDASGVVVAVLDSGVAYEDHSDALGTYVQAPGLSGVPIVAPYDFVNDDAHPNDDHQHGTHIASLIAGSGELLGVAPGATLMPVKVLDQDNLGNEVLLLDGLAHAIDSGADVINLSLSFGADYVPSRALRHHLARAEEAGIIVVAAAGNDATATLRWPAASPTVIAVGASSLLANSSSATHLGPAPYGNRHVGLDFLAPGGNLDADLDGDGWPDGLLAETFARGEPTELGAWYMAGTSQAAAVASGAVALLLADGTPPELVREALQYGSLWRADNSEIDLADQLGSGVLRVQQALNWWNELDSADDDAFHVAILPWLRDEGDGTVTPVARLALFDRRTGTASDEAELFGRWDGSSAGVFRCQPDDDGTCEVEGPAVAGDAGTALQWTVQVTGAVIGEVAWRPGMAVGEHEALLAVVASEEVSAHAGLLGLAWPGGEVEDLGATVAAISLPDLLAGPGTVPSATLFTWAALGQGHDSWLSTLGEGSEEEVQLVRIDPAAVADSPLGSATTTLALVSGTGFSTSPVGTAFRMLAPEADDAVLLLDRAERLDGEAPDDLASTWAGSGGDLTEDGYTGREALTASAVLEIGAEAVSTGGGSGAILRQ